jgi:hypothetical protein
LETSLKTSTVETTLEQLISKVEAMQNTIVQQNIKIEQQQTRLSQLNSSLPPANHALQTQPLNNRSSRRKLLKRMAMVATGAVVATTALATASPAKAESAPNVEGVVGAGGTVGYGISSAPGADAPYFPGTGFFGLIGVTSTSNLPASGIVDSGVFGYSPNGNGVHGRSHANQGVHGHSINSHGVVGTSVNGNAGVYGSTSSKSGVIGQSLSGTGVYGQSNSGDGVVGKSISNKGVIGQSDTDYGVYGHSISNYGIRGQSDTNVGVYGFSPSDYGIYGQSTSHTAVGGFSSTSYGGYFAGGKAAIRLSSILNGIPSVGNHLRGELVASNEGGTLSNLYFCTVGNDTNVGTWVRLNSPYVAGAGITISPRNPDGTFTISSTGGGGGGVASVNGQTGAVTLPNNVNLLAHPVRVAATFPQNPPGVAVINPKLTAVGAVPTIGNSSTVQITMTGATGIPADAKGVIGIITNVGATAGGNLRFWTSGSAPNASNLNIPGAMPSLNLTASFAIPLDASGKTYLGFGTGTIGAQCGYIVDVSGYWM